MKSSKDNEYLLTGNHAVTTSWWRTARCSNSDNNWQLSISQSITVTWWWTSRCSDSDNNRQLSINQSINQPLSLDDGPPGALTMTTINSCQPINHCHLMMDLKVLWQWQQSTAVNQSINQSINHCHLMMDRQVLWQWQQSTAVNQSITVTWCPPVQHQSGNVRNTAVNGRKSW